MSPNIKRTLSAQADDNLLISGIGSNRILHQGTYHTAKKQDGQNYNDGSKQLAVEMSHDISDFSPLADDRLSCNSKEECKYQNKCSRGSVIHSNFPINKVTNRQMTFKINDNSLQRSSTVHHQQLGAHQVVPKQQKPLADSQFPMVQYNGFGNSASPNNTATQNHMVPKPASYAQRISNSPAMDRLKRSTTPQRVITALPNEDMTNPMGATTPLFAAVGAGQQDYIGDFNEGFISSNRLKEHD